MKRRDFLTTGVGAGMVAGAGLSLSTVNSMASMAPVKKTFDLVAVLGGEPDEMFDRAIESLGGMGNYVKKGQKVVVKPNIGWDAAPDRAANTNPVLVGRIVEHCLKSGAKEVIVFDYTCDNWEKCYENSGIKHAVEKAGGIMAPANNKAYYKPVTIVKGIKLKEAAEHELVLACDVFINVPVLKHHGGPGLSISMKNLMGIVRDRGYWHKNDLHQCIADFATYRKPDLNIVDAYRVMKKNGPRGVGIEDVVTMKSLIISSDIVAADAAAAKLFGEDPNNVEFIKLAYELGVGEMDLSKLNINRINMKA